jgi:hypothetical protein
MPETAARVAPTTPALVQALEPRMLLAATVDPDLWVPPEDKIPVFRSPGFQQLGIAHRRFLYEQLSGTVKTQLRPFIDKADSKVTAADIKAYDQALLNYMSDRFSEHPESHWLFDPAQVKSIIAQQKKVPKIVEEVEGAADNPGIVDDAQSTQAANVVYDGATRLVHQFTLGDHPGKVDPATGLRVDMVGVEHVPGAYIEWMHPTLYGNYAGISPDDARSSLNRFPFLFGETLAYRWTGDARFGNEVVSQLKTWSHQHQPLRDYTGEPGKKKWEDFASAKSKLWQALATAIRVDTLMNTLNLMLGTPAWTGEVNTLFVLLMYRHGNMLSQWLQSSRGFKEHGMNHGYKELTALMTMARVFPEFTDAQVWRSIVKRDLPSVDQDNYSHKVTKFGGAGEYPDPDGLQKESPHYSWVITSNLIEQFLMSKRNRSAKGNAFFKQLLDTMCKPTAANPQAIPLATRINALLKVANPDGTMPEIGASYRSSMYSMFLSASLVAEGSWPQKAPGLRDYFNLHNLGLRPSQLTNSAPPLNRQTLSVPGAADTYSLPHNGLFMLQQNPSSLGDPRDATQLTFKIGPMGLRSHTADGHSEYDLLGISLTGRKRPLIQDPGLYTYSTIGDGSTNNWVRTTNGHNSFTVDDYSHARMDGYFGYTEPRSDQKGVYVEGWHNGYVNLDPGAKGPRLARTIWHDTGSTFLVIDWAKQQSATPHTYKIAFTIPLEVHSPYITNRWGVARVVGLNGQDKNGVYTDTSNLPGGSSNSGNVLIQPVSVPNHPTEAACVRATQDSAGKTTGPFVTAPDNSSEAQPAARFYMTQQTDADHRVVNFVTLLRAYDRSKLAPGKEVDTSVRAKVVTQSDDELAIDLVQGTKTRRLHFNSPFRTGGSAMLQNATAKPVEKITDPKDSSRTITVDALPRTTRTPFPDGMESTRPPPREPRGPWIPSISTEIEDPGAQNVERTIASIFGVTAIVRPAVTLLDQFV